MPDPLDRQPVPPGGEPTPPPWPAPPGFGPPPAVGGAGPAPAPVPPTVMPPPRRRWPTVWRFLGPLWGVVLVAVVIVAAMPAPYAMLSPGSARPIGPLLHLGTDKTYTHPGQILFVTVSVNAKPNEPTYFQAMYGWLRGDSDVFPAQDVVEGRTGEQEERYQAVLMENSQEAASYQALKRLGFTVSQSASGAFVSQVVKGSPADGPLQAGDTIVAMDGLSINSAEDITLFLRQRRPGDVVDVTVERLKLGKVHARLTLGSHQNPKGETVPYMGIYTETRPRYHLPFSVDIDTGQVGGPSAGLAFTLALIDKLTPAGITKGHKVAVTGTMELDGSVGNVGGVKQKTLAVRAAGADVFLVPADEFAEAKAYAGEHLKVVKVATLDDALAALKALPKK